MSVWGDSKVTVFCDPSGAGLTTSGTLTCVETQCNGYTFTDGVVGDDVNGNPCVSGVGNIVFKYFRRTHCCTVWYIYWDE